MEGHIVKGKSAPALTRPQFHLAIDSNPSTPCVSAHPSPALHPIDTKIEPNSGKDLAKTDAQKQQDESEPSLRRSPTIPANLDAYFRMEFDDATDSDSDSVISDRANEFSAAPIKFAVRVNVERLQQSRQQNPSEGLLAASSDNIFQFYNGRHSITEHTDRLNEANLTQSKLDYNNDQERFAYKMYGVQGWIGKLAASVTSSNSSFSELQGNYGGAEGGD